MNPNHQEAAGGPLPSPLEQALAVPAGQVGETAPAGGEQAPIAGEQAPATATQPATVQGAGTIPLPLSNPLAPPPSLTATPIQGSTLVADDDKDLIEKEWVDKAKQIVERTRNDPYKQSEELTVFKADYLKKRYGKTIKVSQ